MTKENSLNKCLRCNEGGGAKCSACAKEKCVDKGLLLAACVVPGIASLFYFYWLDGTLLAKWIYLAAKFFIILFPVLAVREIKSFLATLKPQRTDVLYGLYAALCILGAGALIINSPLWQFISAGKAGVAAKVENFNLQDNFLLYAAAISFIHSLIEEYYWRWFVFGQLNKRFTIYKAHMLAAGAFSLHHFVVCKFYFPLTTALLLTFVVFCGGVLFSMLYNRRKSLPGAWMAHAAADMVIFYTGFLMLK